MRVDKGPDGNWRVECTCGNYTRKEALATEMAFELHAINHKLDLLLGMGINGEHVYVRMERQP